jgi:hypothetical protein
VRVGKGFRREQSPRVDRYLSITIVSAVARAPLWRNW